MNFQQLAKKYESELFDNVLPFWLEHSQDKECGGYFSCLDRDGSVYDTDKFIWLQGREVWLFSMLCNKVENRPEWLKCARQGGEFLRKYGHDGNYDWYFSLTRDGRPLIEPYNIFSYTFATMAFAQLAKASGDKEYAQIAKRTFDRILEKRDNPKDKWCKAHAGTRPIKDFALPMILCNLALEIEEFIDPQLIDRTIDECLHEVLDVFYQKDLGLIVENVSAEDNSLVDSFEGRTINPGHSLEAMWFVMDMGVRLGRRDLIDRAVEIALRTIEYGWDKQYGGIFYFMDRLGHPQQQLEWDQKLWWGHLLVREARSVHVVALQGRGESRMVRLSEPPRRGAAAAQGRQMEGLLPRAARTLPVVADSAAVRRTIRLRRKTTDNRRNPITSTRITT